MRKITGARRRRIAGQGQDMRKGRNYEKKWKKKTLGLFKNDLTPPAPGYELRFRCDAQSVENFCAFSVETALQLEIICSVVS